MHIKAIKEVLAQAMNKYFRLVIIKTVVPLSYQRIKHILSFTII